MKRRDWRTAGIVGDVRKAEVICLYATLVACGCLVLGGYALARWLTIQLLGIN